MRFPDLDVRVRSLRRGALALLALAGLSGCIGLSEEEAKQRFQDYVDTANRCERDDECALAGAGCPLGCFVAARADRKADVEAKARELIADYQRGGRRCEYGCVEAGPVVCRQQRCLVLPAGTAADGGTN
jgi:hypothetical protein